MKVTGNEQTTAVLVSYFVGVVRARCFSERPTSSQKFS